MRGVKVLAVALELQLHPGRNRRVHKHQDGTGAESVSAPERLDLDIPVLDLVWTYPAFDGADPHDPVFRIRTFDQGPQLDGAVGDFEIMERTPKVTGRHPEHIAHLRVDQDHYSVGVNADDGERRRLEG